MEYKCEKCNDTGYITYCETSITPEGYDIIDYKEPCSCPINRKEYEILFDVSKITNKGEI